MPAVLVSDSGMPGEDDNALIRRVRALLCDAHGRGPAGALTKPADPDEPVLVATRLASLSGSAAS